MAASSSAPGWIGGSVPWMRSSRVSPRLALVPRSAPPCVNINEQSRTYTTTSRSQGEAHSRPLPLSDRHLSSQSQGRKLVRSGERQRRVASRRRFRFNPTTHDLLDTHDGERLATALQAAAGDGGSLRAGGDVLIERQPAIGIQRARLGNPGTAGRQVLAETAPRVSTAPACARLASGQRPCTSSEY